MACVQSTSRAFMGYVTCGYQDGRGCLVREQDHLLSSSCNETCLEASSAAALVVIAMLRGHHFISGGRRPDAASVSTRYSGETDIQRLCSIVMRRP